MTSGVDPGILASGLHTVGPGDSCLHRARVRVVVASTDSLALAEPSPAPVGLRPLSHQLTEMSTVTAAGQQCWLDPAITAADAAGQHVCLSTRPLHSRLHLIP